MFTFNLYREHFEKSVFEVWIGIGQIRGNRCNSNLVYKVPMDFEYSVNISYFK